MSKTKTARLKRPVRYRLLRGGCILLLAGLVLGLSRPLYASADTRVVNPHVDYIFGSQITFYATLESDVSVSGARFYFSRPEDATPNVVPVPVDDQGAMVYDYDLMRYPLRAFSQVTYRFEVTLAGGEVISSIPEEFDYVDNRFVWQSLQSGPFRVHWYEGDSSFGQELLIMAQIGLQQAKNWLPFADPKEVNIYAYASAQEMRSTNMLAGTNWVAGHADPDLNLIEVSLPPGPEQKTEMERQIPHELMHILLYQLVGQDYNTKLPAWLKEGLASVNEIYPNPYYHTILSQAAAKGSLLSFSDICQNFPVDASGAYLAYAQAASFTRYLYDQYGAAGLESLVTADTKSNGMDCSDGTANALGVTLPQLERNWRQAVLGEKTISPQEGTPWAWVTVLGVVLLVPLVVLATSAFRRSSRAPSTASRRAT